MSATPLARKNMWLALGLLAFALAVMLSVFAWRYAHHQPLMPQGGGAYGQSFHPTNPVESTPNGQ